MYIPDCYNDNYAPEIPYQKQEENTHLVKPPFLYILTLWEQSVEITKNGIFDYFRNPVKIMCENNGYDFMLLSEECLW